MVEKTHKAHPQHPENHPHRTHHPHSGFIRAACGIFTLFVLLVFVLIGTLTNAPFGAALLAFSPALLLGVAGVVLINTDHFDLHYLALVLVALVVVAGVTLYLAFPDTDVVSTSALNIILGVLLIIVLAHSHRDEEGKVIVIEKEQQEIPDLIKTVEDRCKAINFVIGRVYRVHTGAHARLRDKIKIPSDWYNQLTEALAQPDQESVVHEMVVKIKNRLELLDQPENTVFTEAEVRNLKNLDRKKNGSTQIIHVLAENDSDPVQGFHHAALEYCDLLLDKITSND